MHTFPATRRLLSRALAAPILGRAIILSALFLVGLPYVGLRSIANNGRSPLDGSQVENHLFGGSPTIHLQNALYSGGYGWLERLMVYVHASWFVVPPLITIIVLIRWRSEIRSYVAWHTAVFYLAAICFFLFPMQPPWMAEGGVTRILAYHWGGGVQIDNNPVAAMPSLHVALPLTLAMWLTAHRHNQLGAVMFVYSALIAFAVVFLGEHYFIDVLGAVALATAISFVGVRLERRQRSAARNPSMAIGKRFAQPAVAAERGQNLIEFAMLMPFILGLIGAIVILGLLLNTRSSLQQAVREGARQAAVGASLTNIQNLAAGNAPDTLAPADVRVCYPPGSSSRGGIGDPVRVYIFKGGAEGYPFTIIPSGGILTAAGGGLSPTLRMSPQATARLEKSHTIVDPGDLCLS